MKGEGGEVRVFPDDDSSAVEEPGREGGGGGREGGGGQVGRADEATAQGRVRRGGREGGREDGGLCPATSRGTQAGVFNCCCLYGCYCLSFPFQAMICGNQDEGWADPTAVSAFGNSDVTK